LRFALLRDAHLRFLLAPAIVFLACCLDRNYQTDLWHHLARGRVMAAEGRLLDEDRFTFTVPGQPFQDVNWLCQLGFYRLHQWGGLALLQTVNALLLAGMMAIVVGLCRRASGSMAVACGVALFVFLGLWQLFLIRPQTVSLLLFASLFAVLEAAEKRPWLLLFAPLHLALWVNVHGAFPIGLVLIGCYGLAAFLEGAWQKRWGVLRDARVWRLTGCLVVSGLATLLNPYGWRVYEYVRQTSGIASARRIDEWLPPGLNTLPGIALGLSIVAVIVLVLIPGRRPNVRQTVLLLVFVIPAAQSVRMVAWWLIVVAPVLAALIADRWVKSKAETAPEKPSVAATVCCLVLLAAMILSLPSFERWSPFGLIKSTHRLEDDLEQIAQRLKRESTGGRVFTRFEWSEYLTWALGPGFPVFMDGRIEIFPDEVWEDYSLITSGAPECRELLVKKYHVDYLLLDLGPYHARLAPVVENDPGWQQVGEPAGPVLLYRRRHPEKN
jgi:hypothetical protein